MHVAYKKQRNICVKLLRVTDNNKTLKDDRIMLIENEKVASDRRGLVKIFNNIFFQIFFKHFLKC